MAVLDFLTKPFRRGRRRYEPPRETLPWPALSMIGEASPRTNRVIYKPVAKNLRYFSRTPIARRAINAIKNPITQLEWEVVPRDDVPINSELQRQIDIATACLSTPNDDDDFELMAAQVIEDILIGAGAIEIGISGDQDRPLWLWPVDGLSIQIYPGWNGGKNEARYLQTVGYGSYTTSSAQGVQLRDDELIYMRPNPTTATPFGFGPIEIAFNSIARQLATAEFSGKLANNALPPFMLDLGEVTPDVIRTWRKYWTNEVEGEGKVPIIGTEMSNQTGQAGKTRGPNVLRLHPEGDAALYLQYQEFIRQEIAAAFDLSNMNLNIERDVNRNTAEVLQDRDWVHAILPCARLYSSRITTKGLWQALGFYQLIFRFKGLDREDESSTADILTKYYDRNVFTANEIRSKLGEPPAENAWGDMTVADVEIAKMAARNTAIIDDPDLRSDGTRPPQKPTAAPPQPKPKPTATTQGDN